MTNQEFERLYQENFSSVYHYLLRLCRNQDLAEELTSETFFKAIKAVSQFDQRCNVSSWLCQIAKYTYYDYLRKNKRLVGLESLSELQSFDMNIEAQLMDSITSKEICKKIQTLEEPYKKVFMLRIVQEMSFKRIGQEFGKTENWACVTYHRARKKLKEEMED